MPSAGKCTTCAKCGGKYCNRLLAGKAPRHTHTKMKPRINAGKHVTGVEEEEAVAAIFVNWVEPDRFTNFLTSVAD